RTDTTATGIHTTFFLYNLRQRAPLSTLFPYTTLFRSNIATQSFSSESYNRTLDKGIGAMRIARGLKPNQPDDFDPRAIRIAPMPDRKSTRLNSSHVESSYAVFCLKKKRQSEKPSSKSH